MHVSDQVLNEKYSTKFSKHTKTKINNLKVSTCVLVTVLYDRDPTVRVLTPFVFVTVIPLVVPAVMMVL